MTYVYECHNVVEGCPVKITGGDEADVERRAQQHVRDAHAIEERELERRTEVAAAIQRTYG